MNIYDRAALTSILDKLTENSIAQWGVMKPQNMVEHLAKVMQYSNGKKQASLIVPQEKADKGKQIIIYTDAAIPMGVKSPLAGEGPGPDPFVHPSLEEAKKDFFKELDDFQAYHASHPNATFIQPRVGVLNEEEWKIFHGKHFIHHFKQFGLI